MAFSVQDSAALHSWQQRAVVRSLGPARARGIAGAARAVEAARDLAAETGSPAFTVQQLVDRAGISLKSFYRHFAGKDDVLLALFEEDNRRGAEALAAMVGKHAPPAERLRTCVAGLFVIMARTPQQRAYMSVMVREHLRLAEQRPAELRAVLEPFVDLLRREIAAAMELGVVRAGDAGRDAVTVLHLVIANLQAIILGQVDDDPAEVGEYLWGFCRAALLTPSCGSSPPEHAS